jgi:hypothetical protein
VRARLKVNTKDQLERAGYDHAMPEKVFTEFCKENDIDLVTILDALEANQKRDLFPKDRPRQRGRRGGAGGEARPHRRPAVGGEGRQVATPSLPWRKGSPEASSMRRARAREAFFEAGVYMGMSTHDAWSPGPDRIVTLVPS